MRPRSDALEGLERMRAEGRVTEGPPAALPMPGVELHKPRPRGGECATLPLPPSTNNLFISRGKFRVKSPEYRAWLEEAIPLLQTVARPTPPVLVRVAVRGVVRINRDLDNMLKPILDAAVQAGVIENDSLKFVRHIQILRGEGDGEGRVHVEFETINGE